MLKGDGLELPAVVGVHDKPPCGDHFFPAGDPNRLSRHREGLVPNGELQHGKAALLRVVTHVAYHTLNSIDALHKQPP